MISIFELGLFPLFGHLFLEHSNDIIVMSLSTFILSGFCNGEGPEILGWSSEMAGVSNKALKRELSCFFVSPRQSREQDPGCSRVLCCVGVSMLNFTPEPGLSLEGGGITGPNESYSSSKIPFLFTTGFKVLHSRTGKV